MDIKNEWREKVEILKSIRERWENSLLDVLQEKKKKYVLLKHNNTSFEKKNKLDFEKMWTFEIMKKYCKNMEQHIHENTFFMDVIEDIPLFTYKEKKI